MAGRPDIARPGPTPTPEPGARIFAWGAWALLLALELGLVGRFGPRVPVADDFDVVAVVAGAQPATLAWLWSQHNEHRVPLPRLILLGLDRASGGDFRAGMFFDVTILAVLAAAALVVAERRRGAARAVDAVFPLLLLGPGHHANLLWSWQVQFVLSTVLTGALVLLIVGRRGWPGPAAAWTAGAALAALCLCGANGLAVVPAFCLWLGAAALAHFRSGRPGGRRRGLLVLAATVPAVVLAGLYLRGYHAAGQHAAAAGIGDRLQTSLQLLSLLFGPAAAEVWPASGLAALALLASSLALVARVAAVGPAEERPRALGLALAMTAVGTLVLALGWGRAGSGEWVGFEPRYATLLAPLGCALVFAWDLYGPPALRRLVPNVVLAAALVLLWPNAQGALEHGRTLAGQAHQFERDVREGVPLSLLVRRHSSFLHPSHDELTLELRALRRAGIGVFAMIREDPPSRAVAVPLEPADVRLARWEGRTRTAHVTGVDPYLHFVLPEAVPVAGLRIGYTHTNPTGTPARFKLLWTSASHGAPAAAQSYANWAMPTGRDRTTTVRVGDVVKEFWIQPDNQPCTFTIHELTLLVPEGPP